MAGKIDKDNLWSDYLTKNILTTYAEGLACKNFGKIELYNVRRYASDTWWVLKDVAGKGSPSLGASQKTTMIK